LLGSISDIIESVRSLDRSARLVVAGSTESAVLDAAWQALQQGLVDVTLVGPAGATAELAEEQGINLDQMRLINTSENAEIIAAAFGQVRDGQADLVMKGAVPTDELMRIGALDRRFGLRTDRILSHVAVFEAPRQNRLMILTDAGMNISPGIERKIGIIRNAVRVAEGLGMQMPKVAMLAAAEKSENTTTPAVRDANLIVGMNRAGNIANCIISGPLSLDLAVSPQAAQQKGKSDPVMGMADILVAHDINVGNALFKALQTWVGATIASVVMGTRVPVVVPSRADSRISKLASIALAVMLWYRGNQVEPIRKRQADNRAQKHQVNW